DLSAFLIDPSTSVIYTLSLHDALPILRSQAVSRWTMPALLTAPSSLPKWATVCSTADVTDSASVTSHCRPMALLPISEAARWARSEEHTSELQSRENLVCRLLLEKKKE